MKFEIQIKKIDMFKSIEKINDSLKIRKKVFCEEQKVPEENEFDGLDYNCIHFVAYKNNIAVGTARLREKSSGVYKIERLAVLKNERSQGIGKFITMYVIKEAIKFKNFLELILHSQIQVSGFYDKLGFIKKGEIFFEENIPHIKMIYKFNDRN